MRLRRNKRDTQGERRAQRRQRTKICVKECELLCNLYLHNKRRNVVSTRGCGFGYVIERAVISHKCNCLTLTSPYISNNNNTCMCATKLDTELVYSLSPNATEEATELPPQARLSYRLYGSHSEAAVTCWCFVSRSTQTVYFSQHRSRTFNVLHRYG